MTLPAQVRRKAFDRLFPTPDPHMNDPVGWVNRRLRKYLWSRQRQIMESVRDHRFTAVQSCHGTGKSFVASCVAAWWIGVHPPGSAFVVTTAPTDPQVKAILWREIGRRHREGKLPGRTTLEAKWYAGEKMVDEELIGLGRKPQDYDPDAFQGIHAKYVLVLIDEACGVPKQLFDALETLMTNNYARLLAIGNPDDPATHFETICRPGSGYKVFRIPAWDTPNFTGEYVPPNVAEDLVTPLWVDERRLRWGVGSPLWQSKVEALFPEISNDTLIMPGWVRLAQERSLAGLELGCYGFDVARMGADETCGYRNRGGKVRLVYSKHQQTTDKTSNDIKMILLRHGVTYVPAYIDTIGIGAGVVDTLRADGFSVIPVNASLAAYEPERFANRRAEMYWTLRDDFERGAFDVDPDDDRLAAQLTSIKWKSTRKGQILIESKDDMKRRRLPSPDRADAFCYATTARSSVLTHAKKQIIVPTVTTGLLTEVM